MNLVTISRLASTILLSSSILFQSCNTASPEEVKKIQGEGAGTSVEGSGLVTPTKDAPIWAGNIAPEMLAVLEQLDSFSNKPFELLTPIEARRSSSVQDAVDTLIKRNDVAPPTLSSDTSSFSIPVKNGKIVLRVYTPKQGQAPFPVIVYYHGGGFVLGNVAVYDASARALAEKAEAIVVSVNYRLAPEHKFPTAHEDALAAYEWVLKNTQTINASPNLIAVAGESAGANLAANVCMMAKKKNIKPPVHQLLIYPIAGPDMNTDSYQKFAAAQPLNKAKMMWFFKQYLQNDHQINDPRIALVNADLQGLPSTTVITAGLDPLYSEGILLVEKLKAAKVKVESKNYPNVTHEFFGLNSLVPQATEAQLYAGEQLKAAFAN